jgi:hypothetical protein
VKSQPTDCHKRCFLVSANLTLLPNQAQLLQQYVEQYRPKEDADALKKSFMAFVRAAWHVVEPSVESRRT